MGFSDSGVTVAEMHTNKTPMISCTKVSKNGRLAGRWKARRFATASPIKTAAMSPASSRTMSQTAATPTTIASWAVVRSTMSSSSLDRHNHSNPTPTAAPAAPMPRDSRNWPTGWATPPLVRASTAWNTTAPKMPPIGSISEPSQDSIRWRRSAGRTKASSGPTTVGPDTTKIAPSMSAAPADMPSSGAASTAANAIVTGTPQMTSRGTTRRARPHTLPHFSAAPESYRITATESETSGWNAAPSRRSGLTSVVSAPTVKPAGSRIISAGMRSRLATTWEPTASTKIRPTPNRIWSVLIACPFPASPSFPHQNASPRAPRWPPVGSSRLASRPETPGPLRADGSPGRFPGRKPAPVKHPPAGPRQPPQHGAQRDGGKGRSQGLAGYRCAVAERRTSRRARRVHPQPDRAARGQAATDRDPARPLLSVRCGPPGRDPGGAERPPEGGQRRAPQQDGRHLAPGARGPLGGGRGVTCPAGRRHRQHGCAGQEHRYQQRRQAGRDLVDAPAQRVAIQAQPARQPRLLHARPPLPRRGRRKYRVYQAARLARLP